jgi:hypothetical protein
MPQGFENTLKRSKKAGMEIRKRFLVIPLRSSSSSVALFKTVFLVYAY